MTENDGTETDTTYRFEMDTANIEAIMALYPPVDADKAKENFDIAKNILQSHYSLADNSVLKEVLSLQLINRYHITGEHVKILRSIVEDITKNNKATEKARKQEDKAKKEDEEKAGKQAEKTKKHEEFEAKKRKIEEKNNQVEKSKKRIAELYETLENKAGKALTAEHINAVRAELRELSKDTFWTVEGLNQNSMGHLSLRKLEIADYIHKAFNIIKYGGRNWYFNWDGSFYTNDANDVFINKEVAEIMKTVGDGGLYKYNGNLTQDKSQIIDLASLTEVTVENPFNKHNERDIMYINAKNGVIKLDFKNKTIIHLGKRPDFKCSYSISAEFHPQIVDTEIHNMLRENLGVEPRERFYEMAAIAIRDADPKLIPSKVAFMLIGRKNTGKNVTVQILTDFFGYGLVSRTPLIAISKDPFQLPLLEGKLINFDDELPESLPLTESRQIKSLTGGKFHTLNPKNVKPYSGVITALLVFAGNQFPKCQISRKDTAFWDRWQILYFEKKAHAVDEGYMERLLTPHNLSGFFNRVIAKLFEIHDKQVSRTKPDEAYTQWMFGDRQVAKFIHAKFKRSEQAHIYPVHELFEYYEKWYKSYEESVVKVHWILQMGEINPNKIDV